MVIAPVGRWLVVLAVFDAVGVAKASIFGRR
jgi:hypothetical protein